MTDLASSRWALAALVVANLMPLFGVLALDWRLGDVMMLYWIENGVIGLYTLLRMLTSVGTDNPVAAVFAGIGKLFSMAFFTFHYGMFWTVHGIFVVTLFIGEEALGSGFPNPFDVFEIAGGTAAFGWALLALVLSHGTSFVTNWLGRGEYRGAEVRAVMMQPYGRVIVLHIVILFGGFAALALGQPILALLLLVALKVGVDVAAHLAEHRKARQGERVGKGEPAAAA